MAKLNQIIAIEKGIKAQSTAKVSELYKVAQKPALFDGLSKTYQPVNSDDQERLPPETKRVSQVVPSLARQLDNELTALMSITARKDWTNCVAKGDVVVDDVPILSDVPVTYLLFLEKQVTDIRTFVNSLPVLDPGEDWKLDANSGLYKTLAVQTHRTKKVQKPIVMTPTTVEHPGTAQLITEDVLAGFWNQVKSSGAIPGPAKNKVLANVDKLLIAIKMGREAANIVDEVQAPDVGKKIFDFVFPEDAFTVSEGQ